jgi:hypothetical protein
MSPRSCRFINSHPEGPWDDFILSEWVESGGETVILKPGDSARVNPGRKGRYWAPVYARMVTIYGPNPEGTESHSFRYLEI